MGLHGNIKLTDCKSQLDRICSVAPSDSEVVVSLLSCPAEFPVMASATALIPKKK